MFNLKNVAASAGVGFVLSFLISIISTHRFFVASFRGIIFAVVFALLAFAAEFLNKKFLSVETLSDSKDEAGKKTVSKAGSVVNITIDDENLTEDEAAPNFDVSANKNFFNGGGSVGTASKIEEKTEEAPAADSLQKADSSVAANEPVENAVPVADSSAPEKIEPEIKPAAASAEKASQSQEIDALPDIGVFSGESDDDGGVINDSDFAQTESSEKLPSAPTDGKVSVEQDTKTIASAIRTLLKKDEM
ncbi:hypothetical protein [uncultured Treponema sp.]|uniref:hypothetical protein n=1 Tax=uncultured Treponema sp. TaxID=162155 RepID=UPI0025D2B0DA|nr:hypothetical protein [uncultured Treponema sp.]